VPSPWCPSRLASSSRLSQETHFNALGAKGVGEIGIVGTAAAIANAVYHATGVRVRDLPITIDKLLGLRSPRETARTR